MRFGSASSALSCSQARLSRSLVGDTLKELIRLSDQVPALGGAQYVECRLTPRVSTAVDLLISATKFERQALSESLGTAVMQGSGMAAFVRMVNAWNKRNSLLYESVPVIWVEFDDVAEQQLPTANVCASVVPSYIDPFAPVMSQAPADLLQTFCECVQVIRGTPCSPAEGQQFQRLLLALPSGAHWIHLSVMTARQPTQLKLYGVFPSETLVPYLEQVGWHGNYTQLQASLDTFCDARQVGDKVYVDLPLTDFLAGNPQCLGLCFSQQQVHAPKPSDPRRIELLSRLLALGLCDGEQLAALCDWPCDLQLQDLGVASRVKRWTDIKLVHQADRLFAKAYLGYSQTSPSGQLRLGV